ICRKQSGHVFASTEVKKVNLEVTGNAHVTWYQSSPKVRRGFCARCGCSLFWDPPHHDWITVAMGACDGPTGTQMNLHIFVAEKDDYYDIADGLPQNAH
ncbi:MAG: GFA family protein, partial [Paracoccaceae bacterium]